MDGDASPDPARCHVVGRIGGMKDQSGRVHAPDGYGPTVMANRFGAPASLVMEDRAGIDVVGHIADDTRHESANRVYGTDGVAPTVITGSGGGLMPKIAVRAPEPSIDLKGMIRDDGFAYVNKVYGADGVSPTILGNDRVNNVPKVEVAPGIVLAGRMPDTGVEQAARVYSPESIAPTLVSVNGTGSIPKVDVSEGGDPE